ncbi:MAG: imidazole glycerol phosphate synthase subunit HisH [Alphaproteobacteria bacterium]|nr:imidazole glycerol phosphate synthase subunit HisH [Alphaproteobacteria bacterium]MBU0864435.1 imidazole glycerol phosphate synthase subunit HisH [Alphaproteobacteria bacterium]MBU1823972.1 imidazole glycerol phosphate synthase subunit HisH [Alphaproteobacteria bacterium]
MTVLIVDYGMGNIASARRAIEECGGRALVSDDPAAIKVADRIVVPGVGAFPQAMARLREASWVDALRAAVHDDGLPLLGICLGMQLLTDESDEVSKTQGLGLIPGRIERIVPADAAERVPHVGWNEVCHRGGALFDGIPSGADFYFVHSFRFVPASEDAILATTPYAGKTVSAVGAGRVAGVQFHPEKSSRAGFRLLKNFLAL